LFTQMSQCNESKCKKQKIIINATCFQSFINFALIHILLFIT